MNNYSSREQALYKNWCLVDEQIDMRESFCGVGTRKIKVFLNQKVKRGDKVAELLRVALELNDVNVSAKRYWGDYKRDYYSKKEDLIRELNHLYRENGELDYGYHYEPGRLTTHIMYYELPNGQQISFHCKLWDTTKIPLYGKEWDRLENSTYQKLECAIMEIYGNEINTKYNNLTKKHYEN
ncbi:MAG: hypothetical protein J6J25_05165 [Bacteroidales bacterium]|nr:hypothetical protein [Bacteroidales bacterium]